MLLRTLITAVLLLPAVGAIAYDQPWNGGKEDITSPSPGPQPNCPSGNCAGPSCNNTSSPVYAASGQLVWSTTDLNLATRSGLGITRTYNSFDHRLGLFGHGWVTAQEQNIARTYKAVTEGNANGQPTTATEFELVPVFLASYGTRYPLEETAAGCKTPGVLYFSFEKRTDGGFTQVFENSKESITYNAQGKMVSHYNDVTGTHIYYTYDDQGRLTQQQDSDGFSLSFVYNSRGFVGQVEDQAGRQWDYRYSDQGLLVEVTNPDNDKQTYTYQTEDYIGYQDHLLTSAIDNEDDPVLTVSWSKVDLPSDSNMRVASYRQADGLLHQYAYSETTYSNTEGNNVVAIATTKTTRSIDDTGVAHTRYLLSDASTYNIVRDEHRTDSNQERKTYNDRGRVTELTDKRNNVTRYAYSDQGLVTTVTEFATTESPRVTTLAYLDQTNRVTELNTFGDMSVRMTYDEQLRLLTRTEVDLTANTERSWSYRYHPNVTDSQGNTVLGQVAAIDGPATGAGDTTSLSYNSQGKVNQVTLPTGLAAGYQYNDAGQLTSMTDANGEVTTLTLDSQDRITTVSHQGRVERFTYNREGLPTSMTDALGRATQMAYNNNNEITRITYPSGDYAQWVYADIASTTPAQRRVTQTEHLASGVIVASQVSHIDAHSEQTTAVFLDTEAQAVATLQYDGLDQLTGQVTTGSYGQARSSFTYDNEGRLSQLSEPNGTTRFSYNNLQQLTQVTNAMSGNTDYLYTAWGELLEQTSPDTGTSRYQVDSRGNRLQIIDAEGRNVVMSYDDLSRPTQVDSTDNSLDINFTYDEGEQGKGHLTSVQDASGSHRYAYNNRNLISQASHQLNGQTYTVGYQYNLADESTGITYPSGAQVTLSYDDAGRLSGVSHQAAGTTTSRPLLSNFIWRASQLANIEHSNGLQTGYQYDPSGRLTNKTVADGSNTAWGLTLTLDNQSNIIQQQWLQGTTPGTTTDTAYTYDASERLSQDGERNQYQYNPLHNRLTQTDLASSEVTNFSYDNGSNRLNQTGSDAITLDASGRTTQDQSRSYTYNELGELASASTAGNSTNYTYNYANQRTRKQSTTIDTTYVYGQAGELLGEYETQTGEAIAEYVYHYLLGTPELVAKINPDGSIITIHTDHLATPRLASDSTKAIVWQWQSDAFGTTAANEDVDGDDQLTVINHRFPGQYFDEETKLHYNWHRYYDPSLGRYITSDPVGLGDGPNTYGYVGGNSLNAYDPDGQSIVHLGRGVGQLGYGVSRVTLRPAINAVIRLATGQRSLTLGGLIYDTFNDDIPVNDYYPGSQAGTAAGQTLGMAASGNVADTGIIQDYSHYVQTERDNCRDPQDKCAWLKQNQNAYSRKRYKATEKAWGCRRSRQNR